MPTPLFHKAIDVILEDTETFSTASEALEQLDIAKQTMAEAERQLSEEIEMLNNRLALEIRRSNPALNVALTREGRCLVKYKNYNNSLTFTADPEQKCFKSGVSAFDRRFRRYYGHTLTCAPETLGEAIGTFFKQNYRSMQ